MRDRLQQALCLILPLHLTTTTANYPRSWDDSTVSEHCVHYYYDAVARLWALREDQWAD
jgi:hypothetical protein